MEVNIAILEKQVDELEKQVTRNTKDIQSLKKDYGDINERFLKIEINTEHTVKSVDEIKKSLQKLSDARIYDHYQEPLNKYQSLANSITNFITLALVSYLVMKLFPVLG
jgi:septal ring factor EnvC (AmiA/AmiB activator)